MSCDGNMPTIISRYYLKESRSSRTAAKRTEDFDTTHFQGSSKGNWNLVTAQLCNSTWAALWMGPNFFPTDFSFHQRQIQKQQQHQRSPSCNCFLILLSRPCFSPRLKPGQYFLGQRKRFPATRLKLSI